MYISHFSMGFINLVMAVFFMVVGAIIWEVIKFKIMGGTMKLWIRVLEEVAKRMGVN